MLISYLYFILKNFKNRYCYGLSHDHVFIWFISWDRRSGPRNYVTSWLVMRSCSTSHCQFIRMNGWFPFSIFHCIEYCSFKGKKSNQKFKLYCKLQNCESWINRLSVLKSSEWFISLHASQSPSGLNHKNCAACKMLICFRFTNQVYAWFCVK